MYFVGANNCTADGTGHGAAFAQYDDAPDLISITASYRMHACIGEWDDDPAKRVILDCGNTKSIHL